MQAPMGLPWATCEFPQQHLLLTQAGELCSFTGPGTWKGQGFSRQGWWELTLPVAFSRPQAAAGWMLLLSGLTSPAVSFM